MRRSTSSASARVTALASTRACASAGTTFTRVPPCTCPTVSVTPLAGSWMSSMARICRASSRMALTPLPGSSPACAGTPRATTSNCPTPLRLVLSAPPGRDGSNTSTASLLRASASMSAREVALPVSSSVVHSITMRVPSNGPAAITARVARVARAMPAFMSKMPGPCRRPSLVTSGIRCNWPTGQTVSKWPSSSTCRSPEPKLARR